MSNRSSTNPWPAFAALGVVLAIAAAACAPRALPASFPKSSAASPAAVAAPAASVGAALAEDPPLPGEPTMRWPGLVPAREPHHHDHQPSAPDGGAESGHAH
ncbi:Hypothetical protein A7982_04052 [Minicystis rosea]|nr:Hypothetical protein A7982_04052 [Minicystis rosea]